MVEYPLKRPTIKGDDTIEVVFGHSIEPRLMFIVFALEQLRGSLERRRAVRTLGRIWAVLNQLPEHE